MSLSMFPSTNINLISKFNLNKAWGFFVGGSFVWVFFFIRQKSAISPI